MKFTLEIKIPKEALVYRSYFDFPSKLSARNFGIKIKKQIEEDDNYKGCLVIKKMSIGSTGLESKDGSYFLNQIINNAYAKNCESRENCARNRIVAPSSSRVVEKKIEKPAVGISEKKIAEIELSRRRKKIEDCISDIIHAILFCHFDMRTAFVLINELKVLLVRRHTLKHNIVEPHHYNTKRMKRLFGDTIVYGSKLVLRNEKKGIISKAVGLFKRG